METISYLSLKPLSPFEINKIEKFRNSKQTAVLAILFSDIVDSSSANEKLGEKTYAKLRHIHDEIFKRIMCRDNAGVIIKEIGDSFLCVFSEPSTAVIRAIEFQRAVNTNKKHLTYNNYTLTVRIGIHIGQVVVENTLALDIFGRHVNRAARIQAIAIGGQILTSQAIWDNAVGWLKDNNEENIEWHFYGKTKLKGVVEQMDVYEFYPKELGKLATPIVFRKQKQKKRTFIIITVLLFIFLSLFWIKEYNQIKQDAQTVSLTKEKQSYYVHFDFSAVKNNSSVNLNMSDIAIANLEENLLAQFIPIFTPDSIVTESDLREYTSKQGALYSKHDDFDTRFFRDSLGFSGTFFIEILSESIKKDSVSMSITYSLYYGKNKATNGIGEARYSLKNIHNGFRQEIQDILLSEKTSTKLGRVLNSNDSIVIFDLYEDSKLKAGTSIKFMRMYSNKEGLSLWLEDVKQRIDYFSNKPEFAEELKKDSMQFEHIKNNLAEAFINNDQSYTQGTTIGLIGKVIELYDSTGVAKWKVYGNFSLERPRKGDEIYITY